MPAAKIFLNFDTRKFLDQNGANVTTINGKAGSVRKWELAITQNDTPLDLPDGTTVSVGVKDPGADPGTLLASADATLAGWGSGSRWFYLLDLTDTGILAFIGTAVKKNATFEVLIELPDGQKLPSLSVPFELEKNVV